MMPRGLQRIPDFRNRPANPRIRLDLRAKHFGYDTAHVREFRIMKLGQKIGTRVRHERTRGEAHEKELFLNAERDV